MSSRRISQLLASSPDLKRLRQEAQENESLLHLVKSRLPDPLCDHCIAASLDGATLQLMVDSPAWNTRLRYLQGNLIQALAQADLAIRGLKVITRGLNPPAETAREPRTAQSLCMENAALIRQTAASIRDEGLRQALERIARHSAAGT